MNSLILDQMEDLGYDTHNSIVNLSSLGLFSFIWVLKVSFYVFLFLPLIGFGLVKSKKFIKYIIRFKKGLFFTEFIAITQEGYIEFLIAAYLNLT